MYRSHLTTHLYSFRLTAFDERIAAQMHAQDRSRTKIVDLFTAQRSSRSAASRAAGAPRFFNEALQILRPSMRTELSARQGSTSLFFSAFWLAKCHCGAYSTVLDE